MGAVRTWEGFLTSNFELFEADMQIRVINWCVGGPTKDFSEQRRAEESLT